MKQTQTQIVREQLLKDGSVSRNWALSLRITRLAAIIQNLQEEGFLIEGRKDGGDWRYTLHDAPKPKPKITPIEEVYKDEMGVERSRWSYQPH